MKTVVIPKRQKGINALLEEARRQNLILRSPDGHDFILAEVDDFNREIELTRQNRQLMVLLDERATETRTMPLDEVRQRLGFRSDTSFQAARVRALDEVAKRLNS